MTNKKLIPLKICLCCREALKRSIYNTLDPISKLISNMLEIKKILIIPEFKIFILYYNKNNIEEILYNEEEIIKIENEIINNQLVDYFYLSLLIRGNPDIINYVYSFSIIKILNEKYKKDNNEIYKKVIISKIILELINNYKGTDNYDEKDDEEIQKIENENTKLISDNIFIFRDLKLDWDLDDFKRMLIDEIYIKIIIALIKIEQFDNYDYTSNILEQLDLKNIEITKKMLDELDTVLNSNESYINNYNIFESKDLFEKSKINFYYVLFKYILKNIFNILQINYLQKLRKKIIYIIKYKLKTCEIEEVMEERLKFVLKSILDSDYYVNYVKKITDKKNINNMVNNDYDSTQYSNFIGEDKTENRNNEKKTEIINDLNFYDFIESILYYSSYIFNMKEKKITYFNILNENNNNQNMISKKKNNSKINDKILYENFRKYLNFIKTFREKIQKEFSLNYNLLILMNIYEEGYNNDSSPKLTCIYTFYPPNSEKPQSFKDDNILINGFNSFNQGFNYLINQINQTDYKDQLFVTQNIPKLIKETLSFNNKKIIKKEKQFSLIEKLKLNEGSSYITIIFFKKSISQHTDSARKIIQLLSGDFISIGLCKKVFIYDDKFIKRKEIHLNNIPNNITEIKYGNNKEKDNNLKIVVSLNDSIVILSIDNKNNYKYSSITHKIPSNCLLEVEDNKYINCNNEGVINLKNILNNNIMKEDKIKILRNSYKIIKEINNKIIVFSSNGITVNGKDKIIIYNYQTKEIIYELEGFSFTLSLNGILLMDNKIYNEKKILICACNKYVNYQENGILLISVSTEEKDDIYDSFYGTGYFQPFCFCNILYIINEDNSIDSYNTDYFLVGGFDQLIGKGVIKLYKLIYDDDYQNKIEYIQDITFENDNNGFNGFNGSVTCITQSKNTGELLITCSNGNVDLFSAPNINYYLFYDEQEKKGLNYDEIIYNDVKANEKNNLENNKIDDDRKTMLKNLLENKYKEYLDIFTTDSKIKYF